MFQILLGTASVGFIFLTATGMVRRARRVDRRRGSRHSPGLFTFYESLILQASLDAFLTSAALLCVTRGADDERERHGGRPPGSCSGWRS